MGVAPDNDDGNEYENDEEDGENNKDDDEWPLLGTVFFIFPFWCLDAKGGEEYLSLLLVHRLFGFVL
jgi:hypothetical protein